MMRAWGGVTLKVSTVDAVRGNPECESRWTNPGWLERLRRHWTHSSGANGQKGTNTFTQPSSFQ
jgi:hypothetical protein